MSYRKAGCFLVILFCMLTNLSALASTRLISCRPDRDDEKFVCLNDAVAEVKPNLGKYIYIVGYGNAQRVPCSGRRIANLFRRQLLDAIEGQGIQVDESLVRAVDGGHREEALIEIYASSSNEQPPNTAKWPPNCR